MCNCAPCTNSNSLTASCNKSTVLIRYKLITFQQNLKCSKTRLSTGIKSSHETVLDITTTTTTITKEQQQYLSNCDLWTSWARAIDDYAKDGGEELFTKMHCVQLRILNDPIGILTGYVSPSFNNSKYMPVPSRPKGPLPI